MQHVHFFKYLFFLYFINTSYFHFLSFFFYNISKKYKISKGNSFFSFTHSRRKKFFFFLQIVYSWKRSRIKKMGRKRRVVKKKRNRKPVWSTAEWIIIKKVYKRTKLELVWLNLSGAYNLHFISTGFLMYIFYIYPTRAIFTLCLDLGLHFSSF